MAAVEDNAIHALEEEVSDTEVALLRKRSEISNLKLGYVRAVEGSSPLPAEPLRRNLIAARVELSELERRLAALREQLHRPEVPGQTA